MKQPFIRCLLILVIISLTACQATQSFISKPDNTAAELAANTAEQAGNYVSAAQQYLALAAKSKNASQAEYYLSAAQAFWIANDTVQANNALSKIDKAYLSTSQQNDVTLLEAKLALEEAQAEQSLALLSKLNFQSLSLEQQRQVLKLKLDAYQITNNWLEKANTHLALAPLLDDTDIAENQQGLWQALMELTPQALESFNPGIPPSEDSGWFELAYIVKTYSDNPEAFIVAIENWHRDYPNHPADPELYAPSLNAGTQLSSDLGLIAVLLPESGPYKIAAQAIKQAIITAHLISNSKTKLRFYEVTTQPSNVVQQYQQAVTDNASIVIGPLDKRAVQQLAESGELTIPVLALNRLADNASYPNLFQFGLAPEDDAVSIANYATEHNYKRALVLTSDDNWGARVAEAFKNQWLSNRGTLLNTARYPVENNDFSAIITQALNLDESTQRKQSLSGYLGRNIEFEPRRRQDIDFIFLAAKPSKARQLVPQLKFHRSGTAPIIATSQAYSGHENSQQDIDLNKLIITDIPWMLNSKVETDPVYNAIKDSNPPYFDSLVRLYALGADAYRIIPQLNTLSRSSDITFPGATGTLSIDSIGKINRETSWGSFENGILTVMDNQ